NEILKRTITNTVMLGALAGVSGIVDSENIAEAIRGYMPAKLQEKNIKAALAAVDLVSGVAK
ncbi:MAG: 2-oxoacid:acceptor oxidoreductase family protein, partial [Christensenellales bacterium]